MITFSINIAGFTASAVNLVTLTDAGGNAVAISNAAWAAGGNGLWTYSFAGDSAAYQFSYAITWSTGTVSGPFAGAWSVSSPAISGGYFDPLVDVCFPPTRSLARALALAGQMLNLSAFNAAAPLQQQMALLQASTEIDRGCRWQGRKFDPRQKLEFPRIPYDDGFPATWEWQWFDTYFGGIGAGDCVWDWNHAEKKPCVPLPVLQAVIVQADSILRGDREDRVNAIHDGVRGQSSGPVREDYDSRAMGVVTPLCHRAWHLVERYKLVSGRLV